MQRRLRVAFGPRAPQFGSWNWIGEDMSRALSDQFDVSVFEEVVPDCHVAVFIKFLPRYEILKHIAERCAVVYCPVDLYGSEAEIEADSRSLRLCSRIIVHCKRLIPKFAPYSTVQYLDHHVKYICDLPPERKTEGPILWIGNHSNLPPFVDWVNEYSLPGELWLLTDGVANDTPASELGFASNIPIRVGCWSPERHREWSALARAAIDIKGDDFRARNKPPAKAIDYIASGLPLAMNADSSSVEYLQALGLEVPSPTDTDRWLSSDYWNEVQVFGRDLRERLSLLNIAAELSAMIRAVSKVELQSN